MVVWCTQNAPRLNLSGSRFLWHQPCQHCKYTTSVDIQNRATKTIHSCRIRCERSESARERRIALYKIIIITSVLDTSNVFYFEEKTTTTKLFLLLLFFAVFFCFCFVFLFLSFQTFYFEKKKKKRGGGGKKKKKKKKKKKGGGGGRKEKKKKKKRRQTSVLDTSNVFYLENKTKNHSWAASMTESGHMFTKSMAETERFSPDPYTPQI